MAAAAAIAFAAVAAAGAAATTTGLKGRLFVYPAAPVCRVDEPCTKAAPGVTLVFVRAGRRVARVTTDRLGRYRVALASGTYGVKLWRRHAVELRPSRVVVPRAVIRRVDFTYDSGIR